jgi:glycosyltransferase involved in cell wall biosynthesis
LNEGTPVAIIEAMAAARAVVATAVGGVPDVVINGETGILVAPHDVEGLAAAMVQLADGAAERRRMGAAGRRHVATRYSSARLVEDIDRLYHAALAEVRS